MQSHEPAHMPDSNRHPQVQSLPEPSLGRRQGTLTFDVELGVDDVAHDRGKVEVFDRFLGSSSAGKEHSGQAQVLASTGVKKDLHLFHLAILPAHILQEGLPHVVIQSCKSHFLQRDLSNIELIQLWRGQALSLG